ncbi:MAG TPA: BlaI/MecI/CopY family transcriptional regulator [Candidatus Baltobacteraceae bacterium]|nr:BlaI/MecI/CopY family transcriptional regulator [Candidatus Baltobacteraceae bacterium]
MARKKPKTLTKAELRVMEVLWQRRSGTVADVVAALPPPLLAYTTVLTMLRILEQKGVVRHKADGRAHVYYPCIERDDAATSAVSDVLRSFFADSKTALAVRLMAEEKPNADELASIKALIARYEEEAP